MRELFPGYYKPTDEELRGLWRNAIIAFDANILLNIYRYSSETLNKFFDVLEKIKDRIWIPHQAALEFHERRQEVILDQMKAYKEIEAILKVVPQGLKKQLGKYDNRHALVNVTELLSIITPSIEEAQNKVREAKAQQPKLLPTDPIRDRLFGYLEGRVGSGYDDNKLEEKYVEAERRFKRRLPPGLEDEYKGGVRQYGDVIVWFQLIDNAKDSQKPLIFVTDDGKVDWWRKIEGEPPSARPELVHEMLSKAGVSFYMYQAESFLEDANKYLNTEVPRSVIDEVGEVSRQNEGREERMRATSAGKDRDTLASVYIQSDHSRKATEAANIYITNVLGLSKYRTIKQGGIWPLFNCPECGEEALVDKGASGKEVPQEEFICFAYGNTWKEGGLDYCEPCGVPWPPREDDLPTLCDDCSMADHWPYNY